MAISGRRRTRRPTKLLRWLAVGGLVLIAFLYYRPLRSYFDTKAALAQRSAEVRALEREHTQLVRRLAESTSADALDRDARRLGMVKPGERLYIVKGIHTWLRRHAHLAK